MSVCDTDKNVEESSFLPTTHVRWEACVSLFCSPLSMPIWRESVRIEIAKKIELHVHFFLFFIFFFSRGVNVRERQHTVTDAQREIIVFVYARCDEYNSMQQMYRRLVSLNLWMKKKKKRRTAKSKRKLFQFNLWPFLCLRVVNKINKHKTSNGPFAIAYGERNKK